MSKYEDHGSYAIFEVFRERRRKTLATILADALGINFRPSERGIGITFEIANPPNYPINVGDKIVAYNWTPSPVPIRISAIQIIDKRGELKYESVHDTMVELREPTLEDKPIEYKIKRLAKK